MNPKRIRCDCGRVYDPAKHPKCPDCGTPTPKLVTEPPKSEPVSGPDTAQRSPATIGPTPARPGLNPRILVGGAAVLLAIIVIAVVVRPKPDHLRKPHRGEISRGTTATPSSTAAPSPKATETEIVRNETTPPPASSPTPSPPETPFYGFVPPVPFDLGAAIAGAAPGATIKVPAGFYRGSFVVRQPLHLVGQANMGGMVVLQSEGKPALSVEAKEVSVSGVQINVQGIGQLPAIAVGRGGELKLDGCTVTSASEIGATVAEGGTFNTVGAALTANRGTAVRLDPGAKGKFTQSAFSNSLVGLSLTNGATAELHGCAFENDGLGDSDGLTVDLQGENAVLTGDDCHFTNNSGPLSVAHKAALVLQNSIFKSNGGSSRGLVGLLVVSQGGTARLTKSNFESNRAGLLVTSGGQLELEQCDFDQNGQAQSRGVAAGSLPLSVAGRGSSAIVRQSVFARSAPYAMSVIADGRLLLEETELSGSSEIGVLVGERSAPGGRAEIKGSHFLGNGIGLGICAGGTATVSDSEFRENKDGIVVLDPRSELRLTKSQLVQNRDQGLHVFAAAAATVVDCDLRNNRIGALSGTRGKSAQRALITLQDSRFGGNGTFGAGAARQSELTLNNCTFDGTDKTNIYRERGAVVQDNSPPVPEPATSPEMEASPAPSESLAPSPSSSASAGPSDSPAATESPNSSPSATPHRPRVRPKPTPRRPHPPSPEDIRRTLRKFLPGGG